MTHHWDELSKTLADASLPRRESLRLLGAALAGAVLGSLGLGTAFAGRDPCRAFCKCRYDWQQNRCLEACRACSNDPRRLCGNCWEGYVCSDNDIYNCGTCGHRCGPAGRNEVAVCELGVCYIECDWQSMECDGVCTNVYWDPNNCGACGNVCASPLAPYCNRGECSPCNYGLTACPYLGVSGEPYVEGAGLFFCTDLSRDTSNCGACGHECGLYQSCIAGHCEMAAP